MHKTPSEVTVPTNDLVFGGLFSAPEEGNLNQLNNSFPCLSVERQKEIWNPRGKTGSFMLVLI